MSDIIKVVQIKEFNLEFDFFIRQMLLRILQCNEEKGIVTRENLQNTPTEFLINKLNEHYKAGNFIDCANFCFMLYLKYGDKEVK